MIGRQDLRLTDLFKNRNHIALLALLFVFSWALRTSYVNNTIIDKPLRADAAQYFASAYNLVKNNVYSSQFSRGAPPQPDNLRSPGYPLFLSPLIGSSNQFDVIQKRVVRAQALLDSITVLMVFYIAFAILPFPLAYLASLMAAINPHLIVMCAYTLSETLYTFYLAAAIALYIAALRKPHWSKYLFSGLMFGLATLTRPALFLFPILAAPILFTAMPGDSRSRIKSILILLGAFLIIQSPWTIRNMSIVPPAERDVSVLRASFVHGSYPNFIYRTKRFYGYPYREDPLSEKMSEDWKTALSVVGKRIGDEPLKYLTWYLGGKIIALWQWDMRAGGTGDIYTYPHLRDGFKEIYLFKGIRAIYRPCYPVILLAGLTGLLYFIFRKKWRDPDLAALLPLVILLLYFAALHSVLAPFPRYSIPLRPYLFVLAVYGACIAAQRFTKKISD